MQTLISVEDIYYYLCQNKSNELETNELSNSYSKFHDKYIVPEYTADYDKGSEMSDHFSEVVFGYREQGFLAGYKTALILLSGMTV